MTTASLPGRTTRTAYNEFSEPTVLTDQLNHVSTVDYDDRGVPTRLADELGSRFTFGSSEQGLPLTVDDADGHRAYLTYDDAGNLTSRTDWLSRVTAATYDDLGRRLTETTARGAVQGNVRASFYTLRGKVDHFTDSTTGKAYRLSATPAVLIIRPRGWHLDEAHVTVDGEPMSGSLFDFVLYVFHNAKAALATGSGPWF